MQVDLLASMPVELPSMATRPCAQPRSHSSNQLEHTPSAPIALNRNHSSITTIALSLSSSLLIWAPSFCSLSNVFFSLGPHGPGLRPSNKPDLAFKVCTCQFSSPLQIWPPHSGWRNDWPHAPAPEWLTAFGSTMLTSKATLSGMKGLPQTVHEVLVTVPEPVNFVDLKINPTFK
jgi:hypothetical protein